jgi:hypothetical protein
MNLFRNINARRLFSFLAGLTFLNMAFILAEIDALGISKQSTLIRTMMTSGIEEETESPENTEVDIFDEIDLSLHDSLKHNYLKLLAAQQKNRYFISLAISSGYRQNFSPPPEFNTL